MMMERHEIIGLMADLKLAGMRHAYDEVIADALKRQHPVQHVVGDLLKAEIAERLGFELIGHKLELYGVPIDGAEPCKREGLIFKRHAARVAPEDGNAG